MSSAPPSTGDWSLPPSKARSAVSSSGCSARSALAAVTFVRVGHAALPPADERVGSYRRSGDVGGDIPGSGREEMNRDQMSDGRISDRAARASDI